MPTLAWCQQITPSNVVCTVITDSDSTLPFSSCFAEGGEDRLRPYVAFHAALRSAYQAIVGCLEEQCRVHVQHHLDAATSDVALASFGTDTELSLKQLQLGDDDELENASVSALNRAGDVDLTSRSHSVTLEHACVKNDPCLLASLATMTLMPRVPGRR